MDQNSEQQEAAFAAGCFWGIEETYRTLPGVLHTEVGYMGGEKRDPTYEEVCAGKTGHAETVHITFDPAKVSYQELLGRFWRIHDPTQKDRQGPDIGSQYRSVIFYYNEEQKRAAEMSKGMLQNGGYFRKPIVTEIIPASQFWKAEEYHQQYVLKTGKNAC